jgi:hypothetical protein
MRAISLTHRIHGGGNIGHTGNGGFIRHRSAGMFTATMGVNSAFHGGGVGIDIRHSFIMMKING